MAAGCTIDREPEAALELVLSAVYEQWPNV
jgi:hypothetical protein